MDRVFLDANVLFSAAHKEQAFLSQLWQVPDCRLLTSLYAVDEARRNFHAPEQASRLDALLVTVELIGELPAALSIPTGLVLPDKDMPILLAAVAGKATHLLTGDVKHFGALFGHSIAGVLISRPATYLRSKITN